MKDGGDCMSRTGPVTRSRATRDVQVEQLCLFDLWIGSRQTKAELCLV
jgi:hypothetical protein